MDRWIERIDGLSNSAVFQQVLESSVMTLLFGALLYCLVLLV